MGDEAEKAAVRPRVGFIGLGVMGYPMAGHLAKAGYPLTVYDINKDSLSRLRSERPAVAVADTPTAVAAASDIVVTMLPSGVEVREVALGAHGLIHGFRRGGLLLDTSSSEPQFTHEIAADLRKAGISMVESDLSLKWVPDPAEIAQCVDFGHEIAKNMK